VIFNEMIQVMKYDKQRAGDKRIVFYHFNISINVLLI